MVYLFLLLFIVVSIKHLYDSFRDDQEKRVHTKPFLIFLLMLFYISSTRNISYIFFYVLLTSWLGDTLLIHKGHIWFIAGGASFTISHILLTIAFITQISLYDFSWLIAVIVGIIYCVISFFTIKTIKPTTSKLIKILMTFYLLCNSVMNVSSLLLLLSLKSIGSLIAYLGAILFFISDCALFIVRYSEKSNIIYKNHFTVMLSYLLGMLLLTIGFLFLQ